jgi:mannosylglucosylglycerate synthase
VPPRARGGKLETTPTVCIVSFRLGHVDGVSVEATKWADALSELGMRLRTVAGAGDVDVQVHGLDIGAPEAPSDHEIGQALDGAALVIVENVCSLPLNPEAAAVLVHCLRGRRAILHHHDLPWQRRHLAHVTGWPPDDPAWAHVTINELSRRQLAEHGIEATTIYNSFATNPPPGRRALTRRLLGIAPDELLLLQPTRALPRKNVPAGVRLAEALGATYWLTGPAEDGYGPEFHHIMLAARCPVRHGLPWGLTAHDAYAAADAVVFPSTWEGFGNPLIEAALHRKPLAVGHYPVLDELEAFGFQWFDVDDPEPLRSWLERADPKVLDVNEAIAREHFSIDALTVNLANLIDSLGWGDLLGSASAYTQAY